MQSGAGPDVGTGQERLDAMSQLPELKTEEELAAFVDTHDTAPYWEEMTPVDVTKFRPRRRKQTSVRVPMSQAALK